MATLAKKGTTILARWRKDTETPDDDLVSSRTMKYAVRSDGTILQCYSARFRSETGNHTWGWKVFGKVHKGVDLQHYCSQLGVTLEAKGFQQESVT